MDLYALYLSCSILATHCLQQPILVKTKAECSSRQRLSMKYNESVVELLHQFGPG